MIWTTLTEDNLAEVLAAPLVKALKQSALGKGQTSPLPLMLAEATRKIRLAIAAGGLPVSANEAALPPSLKTTAAWLTLEAAHARIPGLNLSADQLRMAAEARKKVERLAKGQETLELPDDPIYANDISTPSAPMRVIKSRSGKVGGKELRGL